MVKWKRDVILSVSLMAISAALFIYAGTFKTNVINIPAAMPDVYMRIWLGALFILSTLLLIRTLRNKPGEVMPAIWGKLQIFTVVVLFLYIFSLNKLGFRISTAVFMMLVTSVYCLSGLEERPKGGKLALTLVRYLIFSVVVTMLSDVLFRNVLSCNLPTFDLFK